MFRLLHIVLLLFCICIPQGVQASEDYGFVERIKASDEYSKLETMDDETVGNLMQTKEGIDDIQLGVQKERTANTPDSKAVLELLETYQKYWFAAFNKVNVELPRGLTLDKALEKEMDAAQGYYYHQYGLDNVTSYIFNLKIEDIEVASTSAKLIVTKNLTLQTKFGDAQPIDVAFGQKEGYIFKKSMASGTLKTSFLIPIPSNKSLRGTI